MKLVWKIGAGVFVGIVLTVFFFEFLQGFGEGFTREQNRNREKWDSCSIVVRKPVLFSKSNIEIEPGQVYQAKVSEQTGEVVLLIGGKEFNPPQDAIEIQRR